MFEQLLNLINFENIIFYLKEKSLNIHENAHDLSFSYLNNPPLNEISKITQKIGLNASQRHLLKITDSDILREILPQEISKKMFSQGNVTLLAFVFALRHKLTLLNLLFHVFSFKKNASEDLFSEYLKKLNSYLGYDISSLFYFLEEYLNPEFWGNKEQLPIIGFSAVGCFFYLHNIHLCRAFDHYEILYCSNKSKYIFCFDHQHEIFWENGPTNTASTQAKMFNFYLDKNNYNDFNEDSLEDLINKFFHKYKEKFYVKHENVSSTKIQIILNFYNFLNIVELKEAGKEELRKRFLKKATLLHPDIGGSHELFREAREYYETLRDLI